MINLKKIFYRVHSKHYKVLLVLFIVFTNCERMDMYINGLFYNSVKLWLQSTDGVSLNATNVISWSDKDGRNFVFSPSGTVSYSSSELNGYPIVYIENGSSYLKTNINLENEFAIFFVTAFLDSGIVVLSSEDNVNGNFTLTYNSSAMDSFTINSYITENLPALSTSFNVLSIIVSQDKIRMFCNSQKILSEPLTDSPSFKGISFGSAMGEIKLAEVIICDKAFDDATILRQVKSLREKYGI